MTTVLALPNLKPAQLKAFNRCRLFLRVTFLSEIASPCGRFLLRSSWQGSEPRPSPSLWPYQPRPGHRSFSVWRRLLATAFLSGTRRRVSARTKDLSLATPLGDWLPSSSGFRLQGSSFYDPSRNALLLATASGYTCHPAVHVRRRPKNPVRGFDVDADSSCVSLPPAAVPIEVLSSSLIILTPPTIPSIVPLPDPEPPPTTWTSYLQRLPLWEQELLAHVTILDRDALLDGLRSASKLYFASDGGAN